MNKTANFQLTQWEKTDRIMMEDFNRDNAAIDAALQSNADKAAALQTALAGAGNCSIETKSYTGNGNYGQNNPSRITFSKKPKFVLLCGYSFLLLLMGKENAPFVGFFASDRIYTCNIVYSWSGNTLQFHSTQNAYAQGNTSNQLYQAIAFY
ncbi:hypothetical protein [uncultured Dysosmobacter sp.]|uniref:hypothetical protein n=1 Tax=uncultured Dysosmobacter sp. TaxID=2591384 RepID=UPI002671EE74|nr:hypothetical protein [uncultured Dysosmobacter sp.]